MATHKIIKKPKNTTEINVVIPKEDIDKAYEDSFKKLQANLEVDGFRKGNAPKEVAKKHLKEEKIYQDLLSDLMNKVYREILEKEKFKPILEPRVDIVKAEPGEDWEAKIILVEKPEIKLKNYKEKVKEVKKDAKSADIWVPGKEEKKEDSQAKKEKQVQKILEALLQEVECEIADIVLESAIEQRLTGLVDDIRKLGLTVDSYLKSKNLTMEQVKTQYKKETEDTYKLEFVLLEIADTENINVDEKDFEEIYKTVEDKAQLEQLKQNMYMYAPVIRKQRVIDYLLEL